MAREQIWFKDNPREGEELSEQEIIDKAVELKQKAYKDLPHKPKRVHILRQFILESAKNVLQGSH